MAKETLQQKKARLSKSKVYSQVLANLKEIKEVEAGIGNRLSTLEKWANECSKERNIQLRKKRALEVGDEVTMEVKDVSEGGDMGDLGGEDFGGGEEGVEDEGGPDEVVEMEKEMKRLNYRLNKLKKK